MINNFIDGIVYNIKGLVFGIKTWKIFLLAMLRFFILIAFTIIFATVVFKYNGNLVNLVWTKPESIWLIWIWHFISFLITVSLIGISTILSYIISQIFFSVFIMDYMSRMTEQILTNHVKEVKKPFLKTILYVIKQEILRTTFPVMISLLLFIIGWITPFGPIIAVLSTVITIIFLSWDNTDLVPSRRLLPFKKRFYMLIKNLPFHIGFGLYFLIPFFNIVFLSFAPVGATMYYLKFDKNV